MTQVFFRGACIDAAAGFEGYKKIGQPPFLAGKGPWSNRVAFQEERFLLSQEWPLREGRKGG